MRYWLLTGAVALAAVGYVAFYMHVAGGFVAGIDVWLEARRAEGIEAGYRRMARDGFPFRVVVRLAEPRLALPEEPPRLAWQAERLALVLQPWDLRHLIFDLSGSGQLQADGDDGRRRIDYGVADGLASYQTDAAGRLFRLSADLQQVALDEVGGGAATLARAQLHVRPGEADSLDAALQLDRLRLDGARLPEAAGWFRVLGPEVMLLQADLGLESAPPFRGGIGAWLERWRDGGGDLQLRRFKLVWGEVDIEATGTLALDEQLRPLGALTARVKGHEHLVDAAVAAGQMRRRDGETAKALLGLLARSAGGVLAVPVTLQDGVASLGPVPLVRLAPLLAPDDRSQAPPSPAPPR